MSDPSAACQHLTDTLVGYHPPVVGFSTSISMELDVGMKRMVMIAHCGHDLMFPRLESVKLAIKSLLILAVHKVKPVVALFGEIVALLSFSLVFKHLSLGDLEWLMIPALSTNQMTVVRGKLKDQNGLLVPMGFALWAHVSVDVDNKLEAQQQANVPFRLAPQDWKSGAIPWLLAVLAPKEVAQALVKKIEDSVFKDKTYKRFAFGQMGVGLQDSTKESEGTSRMVKVTEA